MKYKKILALDFDGVINSYSSGWKGARNIPDPPVDGAIKWIADFIFTYCTIPDSISAMTEPGDWKLVIFSSRSRYFGARTAMRRWLVKHGLDKRLLEVIEFPLWKPQAVVTIDDRALTFNGMFPLSKDVIKFRPWNKK